MATGYYRTSIQGGASDDLDGIAYASIADGDLAFVMEGATLYVYQWDASNADVEASPDIVLAEDDAGNGAWILQTSPYDSLPAMASGVEATGQIHGLNLSQDTDTDHDVNVAIGSCKDSTNVSDIVLSTTMTKRIDATWVAGDDNGGLMDNGILGGGVIANTVYHVYLILKDSDGSIDVVFVEDTDTLSVAGYSKFRWLGFVTTDASSNIRDFTQNGDRYAFLNAEEARVQATAATFTAIDPSALVPESRLAAVAWGAHDPTAATNQRVAFSDDNGTTIFLEVNARGYTAVNATNAWGYMGTVYSSHTYLHPYKGTVYADGEDTAGYILIREMKLKR